MKEIIRLEVNCLEIEAQVEFDYTAGVPGRLYGLPENQYPAEPEEFEIQSLMLKNNDSEFDVDISELIAYIEEEIIIELKEINEPQEHYDTREEYEGDM
jgi:hypothetical protein